MDVLTNLNRQLDIERFISNCVGGNPNHKFWDLWVKKQVFGLVAFIGQEFNWCYIFIQTLTINLRPNDSYFNFDNNIFWRFNKPQRQLKIERFRFQFRSPTLKQFDYLFRPDSLNHRKSKSQALGFVSQKQKFWAL